MNVTSLSELAKQQMLSSLAISQGAQTRKSSANSSSLASSASGQQLSPFAQMLTELQQVEQANPAQYSKMTQQISTNLLAASSTAQIRGNTSLATQLTALSKDFATASQSGQMPNVSDLASTMQTTAASTPSETAPTAAHMNPLQIIGNVIGKVASAI